MPKLWTETIAAHRNAVREAIMDTTAALVAEYGLAAVTMSRIAEQTGIGRATLYKYFGDVEAIMVAWHDRQISRHLDYLAQVRDQADGPDARLDAVLRAYALIHHEHHGGELTALLHRGEHVEDARRRLTEFLHDLITEAARNGRIRTDIDPDELALYCLHALEAANRVASTAAVGRLVAIVLAGLTAPDG
ncbi:MAG: TetR/AcrR family transcriptional regulator [Pseudonocardiales bacterium]|nr:TetR/AcrR family transcriptional regulator [Pseudonocardiales bacterium]